MIYIIVVKDHVRVFEVDESVRAVCIEANVAVGVFALVASKYKLAVLVGLYFAEVFRRFTSRLHRRNLRLFKDVIGL